jgi:hypothetical protein
MPGHIGGPYGTGVQYGDRVGVGIGVMVAAPALDTAVDAAPRRPIASMPSTEKL